MSPLSHDGQSEHDKIGRALFAVIRFDAFQMDDGTPFSAEFVTIMGRRAWAHRQAAEVEAARLNQEAEARGSGGVYFVRALVSPEVLS